MLCGHLPLCVESRRWSSDPSSRTGTLLPFALTDHGKVHLRLLSEVGNWRDGLFVRPLYYLTVTSNTPVGYSGLHKRPCLFAPCRNLLVTTPSPDPFLPFPGPRRVGCSRRRVAQTTRRTGMCPTFPVTKGVLLYPRPDPPSTRSVQDV